MKPRFFSTAIVLAASLASVLRLTAATIDAESTITSATVYVDRAVITREAKVALPVGQQEVLFAGLPNSLDPNLLQVSGSGEASATIVDVRAETNQLELAANPRLSSLVEETRKLKAQARQLDDRMTVLQEQRDYLEKIKAASVTPPTADGSSLPALGEWQQLVTYFVENMAKNLADKQEAETERDSIQQRLDVVQREINELRAPGHRTLKNVFVRLDVAAAGELDLALHYSVRQASWSPTYDVRVTSADKGIMLGYAAMVRQSTGEDWSNVVLVLSTARPSIGGTPPQLAPWYLWKHQPLPSTRGVAADALARFSEQKSVRAAKDEVGQSEPLAQAGATVETGLTTATFTIDYPANIPADNAPHKVSIASHPLEGELSHIAIPKLAELVYMRAAVTNTSAFPLIAGPVNLYLDGTYVGHSHLDSVMPDEAFDLDLGVDPAITIERKLVNRLQENTGIISRNQRVTYDWVITVKNNRTTPEKIVVEDQLPLAQSDEISVKLLEPRGDQVQKDDDGMLTWTLKLDPGEERALPLKISVEYPSDFPISGLE